MFIVSLLISMFSLQCSCTHLQLDGHTDTEADSRPLAYILSVWGLNCFTGFSTAQRNDGDGDDDDDDDDGLKSGEGDGQDEDGWWLGYATKAVSQWTPTRSRFTLPWPAGRPFVLLLHILSAL